ncbi:MAG: hypothetical protein ABI425_02615 [Patescibacteria group bacterium]
MSREMFQEEPTDPKVEKGIDTAVALAKKKISPFVIERFKEPKLFYALLDRVKEDAQLLVDFLENTSQLEVELARQRNASGPNMILGENVDIPESMHSDGRQRRAESGYKINIEEIIRRGIDPTKVLFFRVTQPGETPKPEYYWTTDFHETQRGLSREITPEKRATAVTLIADLSTIAGEEGLIQDINDDQGLAVRQISLEPFDQSKCISIIRNPQTENPIASSTISSDQDKPKTFNF